MWLSIGTQVKVDLSPSLPVDMVYGARKTNRVVSYVGPSHFKANEVSVILDVLEIIKMYSCADM